jgi:hypothetical protein
MAKGSGGLGGGAPESSSEGVSSEGASSPLFVASGSTGLRVGGVYDPQITPEIDKAIRNMPYVVMYCREKAYELLASTGSSNFEVILSNKPDQQRPRAYVCPSNNRGIREELSQAILLKSALGMSGK